MGYFKEGVYMVSLREYFINQRNEHQPGQKGLGMSIDTWKKFVNSIDEINKEIDAHIQFDPFKA